MITNFKIFENNVDDKKFWIVENDENLKVRLFKIGMEDLIIDTFYSTMKELYLTDRYFQIGYNDGSWSYAGYIYASGISNYKKEGYEFMGHVEINDNDIYNYNNRKTITKYNL